MSPNSRLPLRLLAALAALLVLAVAAFLVLRGGVAGRFAAKPAAPAIAAGSLQVGVTPTPETPRVGANELRIQLTNPAGAPVDGAEVQVGWKMAAMGSMPEMTGHAAAEHRGPGEYRARLDLAMNGTWRLEIDVRPASGEPVRLEGSLTTGVPGVAFAAPAGTSAPRPAAAGSGEITIDAERRQRVGIRTARVERGPFQLSLRAVGRVTADETALVDVSVKTRGWITRLHVASLGAPVRKGETLFLFYSPELFAAEQELLQALRSQSAASGGSAPDRADPLVRAARKRLELWNIENADIEAMIRRGEPQESLPIRSPAGGYVIEKDVVEGAAVEPGARLFRIAPLDRVWIEAAIQESELPLVKVGQSARVSLPSLPGVSLAGSVAYVYPTLEADTRTGLIRIVLPNPGGHLLPDMYANVELSVDRGEKLLVPASAVLYAGPRRIVFVDLGEGRLAPRAIEIGAGNGEVYEVLSGLEAGDTVVSSGNFLVASESRLESALSQW
jgi:Cu(I)/Ag(I) efflux system membrane fusion protein